MKSLVKQILRRTLFPIGAERRVLVGPLRGQRVRLSTINGLGALVSGGEAEHQHTFKRLVRPGDCVIDVGSNWGVHALYLARLVGPSGKVLALEPQPSARRELEWHVKANGHTNVEILPVAAGATAGQVFFEETSLSAAGHVTAVKTNESCVVVDLRTLDSVIEAARLSNVRLVKIDVEGFESNVLEGAKQMLEEKRPMLIVDLHNPEQDMKVSTILRSASYQLCRLDGTPISRPDQGWPCRDGVWGSILARPL